MIFSFNHMAPPDKTVSPSFPPPSQRAVFEKFWEVHSDRPLEGRNVILASFCPQVFGLYVVKLSVFLALVGGVEVGVALVT